MSDRATRDADSVPAWTNDFLIRRRMTDYRRHVTGQLSRDSHASLGRVGTYLLYEVSVAYRTLLIGSLY